MIAKELTDYLSDKAILYTQNKKITQMNILIF